MLLYFGPRQGAFLSDSATIKQYLPEKDLFYENNKRSFCYIVVVAASNFRRTLEMKMSDVSSSASSQKYMSGIKSIHDKMMAAVNVSDPDKTFAKGMVAHHEGAIAMAETELKYGRYPEMRKLTQDIIKTQKGEVEQMNKWLSSQK